MKKMMMEREMVMMDRNDVEPKGVRETHKKKNWK